MREKKKYHYIIYLLSFLFFFSNTKAELKIVAKIDNEIITNHDIKSKILTTLLLNNKEINQKNINDLKKNSLEFLIQNRLKKIELDKHSLEKDINKINAYLNSISSKNILKLKLLFHDYEIDFNSF